MHSAAAAIAWEFRRRHRWGLIAVAGCLVVLATIKLVILAAGGLIEFDDAQTFAFVVIVPLTAAFLYFLAVFSFGLTGDLAARQSMYPARMFALPVTTAGLAGWPMLYGTATMVTLWFATRLVGLWPSGIHVPMVWPALLAASLLAWTQALTWMPYPLRGLRVIVTMLWLTTIDAVVLLAIEFKASEGLMVAMLAPHVPLAYFAARAAVGRARRGEVADWRGMFGWLERLARVRRPRSFSSAAQAQLWFEWRRHGRTLPALVAILLPFELALLFPFRDTPVIVFETLGLALVTPPFLALFVAATHGVTPFITTRPLSNGALIAAMLKTAMRSTLAAWLLVLIAIPIAVRLSGTAPLVSGWMRAAIDAVGMPRAVVMVLLGLALLLLSTWKQLVQSLYIGLSGRAWLVKASIFLPLTLLTIAFPLSLWIAENRAAIAALWDALPWIVATLVCVKLVAAGWIAVRLHDARLLSTRTLLLGAIWWNVAVFALYGLLVWLTPEMLFRRYVLMLVAILAIPLARLSAAPLALAWNRHR